MRFVLYTHSLVSDWNHGNAHFLRGIVSELESRGHQTLALEPIDSWSRRNLLADQGAAAVARFYSDFPGLNVACYGPDFDHEAAVADADVVMVHEWSRPDLVARLGRLRRAGARFTLLFHDTHHRGVSDAAAITDLALDDYDAVLAFGEVLRQRYLQRGWGRQVFTWHEAADVRLFHPLASEERQEELIWIGNWGDGERARELVDFLIEPVAQLGLAGIVHGVRYPPAALRMLSEASLQYRGWIANADVPKAFARHWMTVHIPRGPYVEQLPGIPTIRVFEALACGIPLVCAPWRDSEDLFRPGVDYLQARDGAEMRVQLTRLRHEPELGESLSASGLQTILARHTCAHRVDELLAILAKNGTERVRRTIVGQQTESSR